MKRHGVVSVLLLICSSFLLAQNPGAVTPKPPTPLEQSLLERNAAIAQAYMRKDVDFLKSDVMDDFVAIGSDGVPSGKAGEHAGDKNRRVPTLRDQRRSDQRECRDRNLRLCGSHDGV